MQSKPNVFFIMAHPRSGTNWFVKILNLHPDISAWGEFQFREINESFRRIQTLKYSLLSQEPLKTKAREHFEDFIRMCIYEKGVAEKPDAIWFGDKSPNPLTPIQIDGAPHFFMIRDARDVLVSWTYHVFRVGLMDLINSFKGLKKNYQKFQRDPYYFINKPHELLNDDKWVQSIASGWMDRVNQFNEMTEMIKAKTTKSPLKLIKYEDLHQETEKYRNQAYEFLGLDPKKASPLDTETHAGVSKENPEEHNRKAEIGDWKNYLSTKHEKIFVKFAQKGFDQFGYDY